MYLFEGGNEREAGRRSLADVISGVEIWVVAKKCHLQGGKRSKIYLKILWLYKEKNDKKIIRKN